MNWLKVGSGSTPVKELRKHEPGVTSLALENHWKQARDVMLNSRDPEAAITVISHFNQMISFLRISKDDPTSWPKCKEFWINNRCSDQAIKWLHDLGAQRCDKDDMKLVQTLQSLLELAAEDSQILGYALSDNGVSNAAGSSNSNRPNYDNGSWDGASSLSTILLELCISVDPRISQIARQSFILFVSHFRELEYSISQEVTNMTISGLSALFSNLPTFRPASKEQIQPFIEQLYFVDSVVHAARESSLKATIADCFSKNFLYAVILPALTQDEGSRSLHTRDDQNDYVRSLHEEIAVVTSYLQIVCESVTHPILMKSLITFIMTQLLTILLHRMNHPSTAVTVATLSLLNVLLEIYCEDLWYEMILRHLMPQNHLIKDERFKGLPEVDFQDAALRFLSFLPTSVTDVVGPEAVSQSFIQYVEGEELRWCRMDSLGHSDEEVPEIQLTSKEEEEEDVNTTETCSQIQNNEKQESTKGCSATPTKNHGPNPIYPMWKSKYDGSDTLEDETAPKSLVNNLRSISILSTSSPKESPSEHEPLTENFHDQPETSHSDKVVVLTQRDDPLGTGTVPVASDPLSEDKFTTVSLHGGLHSDELNSIGIGMSETSFDSELAVSLGSGAVVNGGCNGNRRLDSSINDQSDGYSSMESGGFIENVATFGPFVDCLFNHLANFTKLDPDVILLVTELVSTLAGSRIPLISSLFLDYKMTLQPSYRSFLQILNRIRLELDKNIRSQPGMVTEVWGQLLRDQLRLEQETGNSHSPSANHSHLNSSMSESNSFHSSFGENFAENLKTNGKAWVAAAMSAVFQRKPIPASLSSNELSQRDSGQPSTSSRYSTGRPGSAEQSRRGSYQQEMSKNMVTRGIYFTHWLLELSAIATQLCWRRSDPNL